MLLADWPVSNWRHAVLEIKRNKLGQVVTESLKVCVEGCGTTGGWEQTCPRCGGTLRAITIAKETDAPVVTNEEQLREEHRSALRPRGI